MAKINPSVAYVGCVQGVFERKHKGETAIVATCRYGANYACEVKYSDKEPSAAQLAVQERFATASAQASADMADPEKKAEWKAIADASRGKFKTPRGAAFASYYNKASGIE